MSFCKTPYCSLVPPKYWTVKIPFLLLQPIKKFVAIEVAMNASILLFMAVVIIGSTTGQFYGGDPYRQYGGGYQPYRPSYGGGYRPIYGGYRPYRPQGGGGYYGGYPSDHHHQYNHGYPGDGSYGTGQGGFAPAGTGPVAPVAVNPSGALAPGSANAGGAGNGAVQNGQAIGTGTGIANAGPGGFGIGLGIGLAVATPLGNLALGEGNSVSVGKK